MKVYITYDRYEHDEWFQVYQFTNDVKEVERDYKENLKSFLSYGPDDCHSYQIQLLSMRKSDYLYYKDLIENRSDTDEFEEFMTDIYENSSYDNCYLQTDGESDSFELIDLGMSLYGLDEDEVLDRLSDDTFLNDLLDTYIDSEYDITF